MKPYRTILVLLLAFSLFCLAGCGGNVTDQASTGEGTIDTLTVGTTMEVMGINIDDYYFGIMRAMLTHMGLVMLGEDGNFTGSLAESWNSQDGQTWTFKLKEGVTWHDGKPVTANDVKFSMEYLPSYSAQYKSHFKLVESVEAPDDETVIIKLSQPNARFLVNLLVLRTLPEHIFAGVEDPKTFNDKEAAIGCGPYVFDRYDEAAGLVVFKANENYYRGVPNIREVRFRNFKNPDTMYMALQKGEVDLPYFYAAGTDPFYVPNLIKNDNLKLHLTENSGVPNSLFFNTTKPPVNDPGFRTALSYAIDYKEMLSIFAAGYGSVPNAGFVPGGTPGFIETRQLAYNPDQAGQLLEELGYKSSGNGFRQKDGKIVELEIIVRNDLAENLRVAELLKRYFEAVGIKVNIKPVDGTLFRTISDQEKSHICFISRTTPWGMMMWGGYGTGYFDARNIGWAVIEDPAFQSIVDKMNLALNNDEYMAAAADLQRYYAEQLPAIPLYWNSLIQPYNNKFEGWRVSPMYGFLYEDTWFSLKQVSK